MAVYLLPFFSMDGFPEVLLYIFCLFLFIDVPLQEVIPEVQVGFYTVRYRFSPSSLAKEVVMFW